MNLTTCMDQQGTGKLLGFVGCRHGAQSFQNPINTHPSYVPELAKFPARVTFCGLV